MSRSFRDLLKLSAPALFSAALLAGCGSGSNGAADLNQGPSVTTPPPPVTVTESFDFVSTTDFFVVGTPPIHARFSGGEATDAGTGAWIIPSGQTGVVDFGTPADSVRFATQDNFSVAASSAGAGAEKGTFLPAGSRKVDAPFDTAMYVRGSVSGDWAPLPENLMTEVSDNKLAVTIALDPGEYAFKIADAGWTGETNCGASEANDPVPLGVPYTMGCSNGSQNMGLNITEAASYVFTLDATGADKGAPKVTVAKQTSGGGGGEPTEPVDSTIIRIFAKDVLTPGSQPTLLKTVQGSGSLSVDELRQGGATRITRIEIENTGEAGDIGVDNFAWTANPQFAPANVAVDIYYSRPTGGTAGTTIAVGGTSYPCAATPNGLGCVATGVPVMPYANASMTVTNADGSQETITFNGGDGNEDVYALSGSPTARSGTPGEDGKPAAVPRNANEVILFYKRDDGNYAGWGLHLFPQEPATGDWTTWAAPFPYEGIDPVWGAYFRIALPGSESPAYSANPADLDTFPTRLGFIIHSGETKDPGPDQTIEIASTGNTVFVVSGVNDVSSVPPGGGTTLRIAGAAAHWVDRTTLLWTPPSDVTTVELLYSPDASINAGLQGITGTYETIPLSAGTNPQPAFNKQLDSLKAWSLPATATARAKDLARGQLIAIGRNFRNEAIASTMVQTAGALDAIYAATAYGETLGVSYAGGVPSLAVWAPTALKDPGVSVNLYDDSGNRIDTVPMTLDDASGIWRVTGDATWDRKFYTISLRVYSYATDSIVTNEVTDPYAVSLSTDSVRSQFVNLDDADLKPAGWDTLTTPHLDAPEDMVIYELHVRDFSIADSSVPEADRGKFTAFDVPGTAGRQHLEALAAAGLTHVHILPAFDFATVKENRADRVEVDDPVEDLCAVNPSAAELCATAAGKTIRQAIEDRVAAGQPDWAYLISVWLKDYDGFNWGYDPLHFGVPEGSYSTDPNGAQRILEFRRMVKGLADSGLGTIMDVVYNHTNASGQNPKSVLDRIVPGYYHRRDASSGNVTDASCCEDTAPEFAMMEKLVNDTGVRFVRDYKVDGFRFDIMGFHPKAGMERFQAAVKAVNPDVYTYGEAWNFGPVQDDQRFVTARQANLGGTGIGSFSDRIRDTVRGGGPFDGGGAVVKNQGFISGWYYDPNSSNTGSSDELLALITATDNIRVWMAGGLKNYTFTAASGLTVKGSDVDYSGQDSGYTLDPQEAINYISVHDNDTLWDISQYKQPAYLPLADRVRAQNVGLSIVLLGQGIPFLHAGSDILRSKSLDANSYDSGDYYNELDWTLLENKWNTGFPVGAISAGYEQFYPLLINPNTKPDTLAMQAAFDHVQEMLEIRKSSPLFRLRTGAEIEKRVTFENTGFVQLPGVIAMRIDGCSEPGFEPADGALMVVINASDEPRTLNRFGTEVWTLHPIQAASADPVVRTATHDANGFHVPARTTAVFRRAAQTSCAPYPVDLYVRGGFNGWGNPNPTEQYKLQFLGGTDYSVSAPISPAGSYEFKIADAGWTAATNCGVGPSGLSSVRLGIPMALTCANDTGNLAINATTAGDYTFALSAVDTTNPVLTVTKSPPTPLTMYVRGGFTDWGTTLPLAWDGLDTYRATAVIADATVGVEQQFKIADPDWGGTNNGATNCGAGAGTDVITIGQPYALTCDVNPPNLKVTFPSAGDYLFAVDATNPAAMQLTVERVPVDVPLFLRGSFNNWADPPPAAYQMSYLGGGVYSLNTALAATANEFKIASSDWATVDCGAGAAGDTVTVGAPLAIACGDGTGNLKLTPATGGTYTFTYQRADAASGQVTVTGP